jgi:acyl-coenzyme A synthetase/AMP-(fatty) acid ligase/pimeloyl-ACP methyl ester carboxylesterase
VNPAATGTLPTAEQLAAIGLRPEWSRQLDVAAHDGGSHRWHLLDRPGTDPSAPTVLCLHGNPTWGFLWSRLLDELDPHYRVVAPDLLGMGFSERTAMRRYRQRVDDVADLVAALGLDRPVWLVAHDWGGALAMGLAVHHPQLVAGMVLVNTGIAVPEGRSAPWLIRAAAARGLHGVVTARSSLFVRGTPRLPGRALTRVQRTGLALPYGDRAARAAVADFVADVPFDASHPSAADIAEVADALRDVRVPVRLVFGAADPVFDDDFADDLAGRFADAPLHRFADCGHLTPLEASIAGIVEAAVRGDAAAVVAPTAAGAFDPVWSLLLDPAQRIAPDTLAISDAAADRSVTQRELADLVATYADGLLERGVQPGDRVAVLVPPSVELIAAVYACWRIGAVTVVADRGLGLRGLGSAVRSARVRHVVGVRQSLAASAALRWAPGAARHDVARLASVGTPAGFDARQPHAPSADDAAAVVFTSGATGPAKGVRYTHGQLAAQRDALRALYGITPADRFVAAFAPFAVFGPALGIATGLADMDVTAPATLTAAALDDACRRVGATMVFASPAALANVLRTAGGEPRPHLAQVRVVMSAGAPVPRRTLEGMQALCPHAELRTPYGMTEVLPVADISLGQRVVAGSGDGVCVGVPVPGCDVRIEQLPGTAEATMGEVVVAAPWMSSGYDRLWLTERRARPVVDGRVWHRTGDVGHVDDHGRLWIEGRTVHLIHTVAGAVSPVPVEVRAETVPGVQRAAAVAVGPTGVQQVVVVVEGDQRGARRRGVSLREAAPSLAAAVRAAAAPVPVAAVLETDALPVDIRHNAKIDRTALGASAAAVLAGGRP